jgi:hypothetical protein
MVALDKTHNDQKRGGSYSDGVKKSSWFSWMPENYPETLSTAKEILDELGFEVTLDEQGNIIDLHYNNKMGQEDLFLKAIAPFVKEGSFINWAGEDGTNWQYFFDGKKMIEKQGQVVFITTTEEE